jgi:hypothetical protein
MKIREKLLIELKNLDRVTKQVSVEHLRLFIEDEKQRRIALGSDPFECYVIDISTLKNFLTQLEASADVNKKFQLIIHNTGHYLTLDILWTQQEKKCLLLDAPNNVKMMHAYFALSVFSFDRIFVASDKVNEDGSSNNLQRAFYGCRIFSFDHAIQLSKLDIYSSLEKIIEKKSPKSLSCAVPWKQLPMQLIWNAQSLTFLHDYLDKNKECLTPSELIEFKNYIQENTQASLEGKNRNVAIDNIFDSVIKRAIAFVETLNENQVISIIGDSSNYLVSTPPITKKTVDPTNFSSFFKSPFSVSIGNADSLVPAINFNKPS